MFLFTWLGRVFALMFNPPHLQFNWFSAVICKVRNGLYTWPIIFRTHCVRSFCVCEMCVRWQSLIMKHINWQRLPPAELGRAETTRNCCSPHKKAVCLAPTTVSSCSSPWFEQATGKVPSKSQITAGAVCSVLHLSLCVSRLCLAFQFYAQVN